MLNNGEIPLRVLILEDRAEDVELILRELRKTWTKVEGRRVEDEAGFQSHLDDAVDIILADYALPEYDALRALQSLRKSGRDIPFIIVTGAISDEQAVACIQQGATDYVRKDRLARLGHAVSSAMEHKRLREEQRHSEQAWRESEAKYSTLFNQIHDPVFVCEATNPGEYGRFLETNESACRKLGYSREELRQLTLPDISAAEQARLMALALKKLAAQSALSFDTELTAKTGCRIPVEMHVKLIELSGRPAILAIARDVSELRKLGQRIYEIAEMEKKFFGQELHDSVGQYLTAIAFKSKILENRLNALKLREADEADALTRLVNQTSVHVRNMAKTLFPVELEKKGLEEALRNLLVFVETQFQASCRLDYQLPARPLQILAATHLFRIIQESMSNAIKHNHARQFKIRLAGEEDRIVLTLLDDGRHPATDSAQPQGIGLAIMDYRRKILNATMKYQPSLQGGNEMILSFSQNLVVIA